MRIRKDSSDDLILLLTQGKKITESSQSTVGFKVLFISRQRKGNSTSETYIGKHKGEEENLYKNFHTWSWEGSR